MSKLQDIQLLIIKIGLAFLAFMLGVVGTHVLINSIQTEPEPDIIEIIQQEIKSEMETLRNDIKSEIAPLKEQYEHMIQEDRELKGQIKQWLDEWQIVEKEVTYYAPLDPSAIPGMCYSGDPNVTASGARTEPGVTVAAGPGVPFGTEVYIDGLGWRTVHDRGGAITNGKLDVAVWSKSEAYSRGREHRTVIIQKESEPSVN